LRGASSAFHAHFLIESAGESREHGGCNDARIVLRIEPRDRGVSDDDRRAARVGFIDDHDARVQRNRRRNGRGHERRCRFTPASEHARHKRDCRIRRDVTADDE